MMSVAVVICIILLIAVKVDCRAKTATPSIHSSRVVSTAEGLASSCAVFEEGVPVCQDPEEANAYMLSNVCLIAVGSQYRLKTIPQIFGIAVILTTIIIQRFATRTPYLQDNWFDGARDDDRKSATESGSRPLGWWWRFIGGLKRNLEKKASPTTTAVRSEASQLPETIVTYSIKGCSPTIVPFDLSPCSNLSPDVPQPASTTRVIYYVPPSSGIDRYSPPDFDQ